MGRLGRVLARLGGLLGRLWAVLGHLGGVLGASWRVLGASWGNLGRLGCVLGRLGCVLWASWRVLGASWAPKSLPRSPQNRSWEPPKTKSNIDAFMCLMDFRVLLQNPSENQKKHPQHKHLGSVLGRLGASWAYLGATWAVLGPALGLSGARPPREVRRGSGGPELETAKSLSGVKGTKGREGGGR